MLLQVPPSVLYVVSNCVPLPCPAYKNSPPKYIPSSSLTSPLCVCLICPWKSLRPLLVFHLRCNYKFAPLVVPFLTITIIIIGIRYRVSGRRKLYITTRSATTTGLYIIDIWRIISAPLRPQLVSLLATNRHKCGPGPGQSVLHADCYREWPFSRTK